MKKTTKTIEKKATPTKKTSSVQVALAGGPGVPSSPPVKQTKG